MGPEIFVVIYAMTLAFITLMKNTPYGGIALLKPEKNILQISHLIFLVAEGSQMSDL